MRSCHLSQSFCLPRPRSAPARTWKPPEIKYDDTPRQAVLQPDPPKPVQIVELPKPLPLARPAQADPARQDRAAGGRRSRTCGSTRPMAPRACSRPAPATSMPCRSIRSPDGALYQVYAAPGEITDIALEAGEQLVGSGPVAAGDTVRWIIGDTESGTGADQARSYSRQADPAGSRHQLVINTDRRTYHLELRSDEKTYMASVSWAYPQDQLIALRRQNAAADAAAPIATGVDITR